MADLTLRELLGTFNFTDQPCNALKGLKYITAWKRAFNGVHN
jgi:hypothetical protein